MCWDSPANGVPSTARRARVFLRTRRYTPDLRGDLGDYRLLLVKIETQGLPPFCQSRPSPRLAAPTATLHSGKSCMGFAICVGRKDCSTALRSPRLNLSAPTVFDNPPHAVKAVRWPKVLSSISMLRRRAAAKAPHVHPHARSHGRGHRHLAQVESLRVGRLRL